MLATRKKQGHIVMRLPKAEVERREQAVIAWFMKNPNATEAALNKELAEGRLTGKKEPKLNIKTVYALRKEAKKRLAEAEVPPGLPADAFRVARRFPQSMGAAVPMEGPTLTDGARKHIQGLIGELPHCSPDIAHITVNRNGSISIGRMLVQEQQVTLGSSAGAKA